MSLASADKERPLWGGEWLPAGHQGAGVCVCETWVRTGDSEKDTTCVCETCAMTGESEKDTTCVCVTCVSTGEREKDTTCVCETWGRQGRARRTLHVCVRCV